MVEEKKMFTGEEAILAMQEEVKKVEKKERTFKFVELFSLFSTIVITILSTVGTSAKLFEQQTWQSLKYNPIFYWVIGLLFFLFLMVAFIPKVLKWIIGKSTTKEDQLKRQILSTYSNTLDKTIVNPQVKDFNHGQPTR